MSALLRLDLITLVNQLSKQKKHMEKTSNAVTMITDVWSFQSRNQYMGYPDSSVTFLLKKEYEIQRGTKKTQCLASTTISVTARMSKLAARGIVCTL